MFRLRRKSKNKPVDEKRLVEILNQELNSYIRQENLQAYLDTIERDKKKKELWDSLSSHKKLKLLRYALEKRGDIHAKK